MNRTLKRALIFHLLYVSIRLRQIKKSIECLLTLLENEVQFSSKSKEINHDEYMKL